MAFLQNREEGAKEKHPLGCAWDPGLWIEMDPSPECGARRRAKGRERPRSLRILIFSTTNVFKMLQRNLGIASACSNFIRVEVTKASGQQNMKAKEKGKRGWSEGLTKKKAEVDSPEQGI